MSTRLCVALVACGFAAGAAAQTATLTIAAGRSNGSPFVLYDRADRLVGGLARDIMATLAVELGRTPRFVDPPRTRIEAQLASGELDAACFLAPAWVSAPEAVHWSPPLFAIQQVVVQAEEAPAASPENLAGKRIGVLHGFSYPELQPQFADGSLLRIDAPGLDNNLAMLARGRLDAVVDVDLAVFWRIEDTAMPLPVRVDALWAPPSPVYCAFSNAFVAAEPTYATRLQAMVDDGRIVGWIDRYTGGRHSEYSTH